MQLQLERLDVPARPGIAFSLIRKLLAFNDTAAQRVEVVILSRNDPVSGMRIFRSAKPTASSWSAACSRRAARPFGYLRPLRRAPVPVGQRGGRARGAGRRASRRRAC